MSGQYGIIYADPPWKYQDCRRSGSAALHYPTMSEKELREYGENVVKDLCAENCALVLWATMPHLPTALKIMKAWGFRYKTGFATWIKIKKKSKVPTMGKGFYTRGNAELCLLGIKGKGTELRKDIGSAVKSVIMTPKREHSRKPDEIRELIGKVFRDDLKRIELFAREKTEGWDSLGNETEKFSSK